MDIYDLLLDEYSNFFSNSGKVFLMLLYRKMKKENISSILTDFNKLAEETMISKSTIFIAIRAAEENGLVKRGTSFATKNGVTKKVTKITALRGL